MISSSEKEKKIAYKEQGLGASIGSDIASLVAYLARAAFMVLKPLDIDTSSWPLQAEMIFERAIINCRFFTLIVVVGSLIGSILCFVEGCFLVLEAYRENFHTNAISQRLNQKEMVQLVVEAMDMFLVGTAMLTFGMGLYSMFISFRGPTKRSNGWSIHGSNLFGLFHLKMLPVCLEMKSMVQAKSKVGHAVVMLLQAGMVEKFKNMPLETGLDLACFAGALFFSSASMFLLSWLHCIKLAKSSEEGVAVQ